jgi:hypothetical protein
MNVTGYTLLGIEEDNTPCFANKLIFEDKNWFKTSLIEMLEKDERFIKLNEKEKEFIKKIITVDMLDEDTIFDVKHYTNKERTDFKHENDEYLLTINMCLYEYNGIAVTDRVRFIHISTDQFLYHIYIHRNSPYKDTLNHFKKIKLF